MSDGLTKIVRFDERAPTGEPTMRIIRPDDLRGVKLASEAGDYIRNVGAQPGKTIVLVLAMSASEYYGPNRNGDAFAERPVPGAVEPGETLVDHYKRFESGQAHVFRHHVNKDPAKAIGKILKAFYNFDMHRVELLLELDNNLANDFVEKIEAGQYPAVSMGCKIKYDVCSICGNKAPTRAEYCDHAKYELNRVYPDGRKSFVWNPSPELFDISFVIRPADRIGYMMKKVAFDAESAESSAVLGEKVADLQDKLSTLKKLSEMDKIIRGQVATGGSQAVRSFCKDTLPFIVKNTPSLDDAALSTLAQYPTPTALSTLGSMGIAPTSAEMTDMMVRRAMPGQSLPQDVGQRMSAMSGAVIELLQRHPEVLQAVQESGLLTMGPEHVNPELGQKMAGWLEKRSNLKEYLLRRAQPFVGEAHPSVGNWDPVSVQAPDGKGGTTSYRTTRGALDRANDVNTADQLKTLAGAGLLAGGAYKVLTSTPRGKYFGPLALALGAGGLASLKNFTQVPNLPQEGEDSVVADEVTGRQMKSRVPVNTELRKVSSIASVAFPMASSAAMTAMLAQEYNRRAESGELGAPGLGSAVADRLGAAATRHPAATFLAGLAGIGGAQAAADGLSQYIKSAEVNDAVKLAEVDLPGLCYWLGSGLF